MSSTLPLRHQSPSHPQIMLHFLHSRNLVSVSILRLLHQGCGVWWCVLDSAWLEHCNTFWCVTLELCQPGGRGKPLWGAVWSAAHHQVNQYYVLYLISSIAQKASIFVLRTHLLFPETLEPHNLDITKLFVLETSVSCLRDYGINLQQNTSLVSI